MVKESHQDSFPLTVAFVHMIMEFIWSGYDHGALSADALKMALIVHIDLLPMLAK